MVRYIARKILVAIMLIVLISIFAFSLIHMLPGDPAALALGSGLAASPEDVEALRIEMHLDKPLYEQYFIWVKGLFTGNLGRTFASFTRSVDDVMRERIPVTLQIGIPAIIIAGILGTVTGIISAVHRGKLVDQIVTLVTTLGLGTPSFWVGIFSVYLFSVKLGWLPLTGYCSPQKDFGEFILKAILPVFSISVGMMAATARQARSNMIEALSQDYIRTARANGLSETRVVYRHALINALIPVITIIGTQMRNAIGGALVVEVLFNIPGIGSLLNNAVHTREYTIIQTAVLFIAVLTVGVNLLLDILYGVIDPRIRKEWR